MAFGNKSARLIPRFVCTSTSSYVPGCASRARRHRLANAFMPSHTGRELPRNLGAPSGSRTLMSPAPVLFGFPFHGPQGYPWNATTWAEYLGGERSEIKCRAFQAFRSAAGVVSRVSPVQTAL